MGLHAASWLLPNTYYYPMIFYESFFGTEAETFGAGVGRGGGGGGGRDLETSRSWAIATQAYYYGWSQLFSFR